MLISRPSWRLRKRPKSQTLRTKGCSVEKACLVFVIAAEVRSAEQLASRRRLRLRRQRGKRKNSSRVTEGATPTRGGAFTSSKAAAALSTTPISHIVYITDKPCVDPIQHPDTQKTSRPGKESLGCSGAKTPLSI